MPYNFKMDLNDLTKEQITTLIICLHEAIIQTNENLSKMIISDEEDHRHFKEINKYWYETKQPVELCCAIGDETIDGKPYSEIVEIAREYIKKIGGFEKFAEWGLF